MPFPFLDYPPIDWIGYDGAIVGRMNEPAVKDDDGKLRYDLIDPDAEAEVAAVLTYGAVKYGPENWRNVDDLERRYRAAARRHLAAPFRKRNPESIDPESKLHHLAQAITSLHFLLAIELEKNAARPLDERLAEGLVTARKLKAERIAKLGKVPWALRVGGKVVAVGRAPTLVQANAAARTVQRDLLLPRASVEVGDKAAGAVVDPSPVVLVPPRKRSRKKKSRR